jgi:hypothetical protein
MATATACDIVQTDSALWMKDDGRVTRGYRCYHPRWCASAPAKATTARPGGGALTSRPRLGRARRGGQ